MFQQKEMIRDQVAKIEQVLNGRHIHHRDFNRSERARIIKYAICILEVLGDPELKFLQSHFINTRYSFVGTLRSLQVILAIADRENRGFHEDSDCPMMIESSSEIIVLLLEEVG